MTQLPLAASLAIALAFVALAPAANAATAQVVSITLRDQGVDPGKPGMVLVADRGKVKSGRVTLKAANRSKDLVHEVLVVPAPPDGKELAYDAMTDTIDEKRAHSLGEISELKPGAHGEVTLSLRPGTYLLLCNQPGHFKAGMSTTLVVEK